MFIPAAVLFFLFSYMPMMGIVLAFKEFNFRDGILFSPWCKPLFKNFEYLFSSSTAFVAMRNTLFLNFLFIVIGMIFEVGLALIFNELNRKLFKKSMQMCIFLPYFISWIVVGIFAYNLFHYNNGVLNAVLAHFGCEPYNWYSNPKLWILILVAFKVWKSTGYGMVLYIASISSIDATYYEAAKIDGANRFAQMRYISIPLLMPTVITMFLLSCGKIMNADFGMFFSLIGNNPQLYSTTDVLDTFIYRNLRVIGDIGMSSAAGLFQSVVSLVFLCLMNWLVKRYDSECGLY